MSLHAEVVTESDVAVVIAADEHLIESLRTIRKHAIDAIRFYVSLFGFYPHRYLVLLPGTEAPTGGYPVDIGIVKIHGLDAMSEMTPDYLAWITAHEIAHMYWG